MDRKNKRPCKGAFLSWRRGWDGRFAAPEAAAPLPGSNRVLMPQPHSAKIQNAPEGAFHILAERVGWPLRGAEGGCAAARLEQGSKSQPSRQKYKTPQKGRFIFWRRGWDSNPRYGRTVHLISNQAHSTTLAPLHNSATQLQGRTADVCTPDLTRRFAPRPAGALCASVGRTCACAEPNCTQ